MSNLQKEISSIIVLFLSAGILGGITGWFYPIMFCVSTLLLFFKIKQVSKFERWLRRGGKRQYPKANGIWEDIYYHLYRLKKAEKKRKKKLGNMINEFRKSTEALPDAAVVLGVDNEIEWANKIAYKVLGLQQADKGQRIPNLIRFPEFTQYLKKGDFKEAITLPSPVNKYMTLSVRVVPYGNGLRLLLAQDVTQLKHLETMRKDFIANVSHELKTPLTVLKGYLETLSDMDEHTSPLLSNAFNQMQLQTDRMQHLIDDLLLLTRLETKPIKVEAVDVPSLLLQICRDAESHNQCNQKIELTLETDRQLQGDEQELRSAFTNLIENALKYSPDASVVKVRWFKRNAETVMSVEDTGEGIANHHILRVTERFYRCEVKRDKYIPGTGLGLSIVKHVLMRHGAHLEIVSAIGKGSCFKCCFPVDHLY